MTDSQKWSIWILALVTGLLVAAFVGGSWVFIAVYFVGRIVARVALLAVAAAMVTNVQRKPSG